MSAPEGYKPVIHKSCGGQHSWVKEHITRGDRMHASDVMLLDGSIPEPHSAIPECPNCHRKVVATALSIDP